MPNKFIFDTANFGSIEIELIYDNNSSPIDYIFLEVNQYYLELFHLERKEIIGKKLSEHINSDHIIFSNPELFQETTITQKPIHNKFFQVH